jgi:hypothetical protein
LGFKLNRRSRIALRNVHPDLIRVLELAASRSDIPFIVTSGLRTAAEQNQMYKRGASKLDGYRKRSYHQDGLAADVAVCTDLTFKRVTWDWTPYYKLSKIIKKAAADLGVSLTWGGDWKTFKDGPHYQIPRRLYPNKWMSPSRIKKGVPPAAVESPVIPQGATGEQKKALQRLMNIHGANPKLKIDGRIGDKSKDAAAALYGL